MRPFTLTIRGTICRYTRPAVMGILNVTPDSFYAGSRTFDDDGIRRRVRQLISEGADFIDIGAYSTRPGADDVSTDEEIDRLSRGMRIVRDESPDAVVSVDTFRAAVADIAVTQLGCDIINDISGTDIDPDMTDTIARLNVPYILMHTRGTPAQMAQLTRYDDVTAEVLQHIGDHVRRLALAGVNDIIVDPGIGFAKTPEQNYRLIHDLDIFSVLHRPVLVGVSRKSLLTKLLDIPTDDALNATTALNALCLDRGADILRVHDVAAAVQCVKIYQAVNANP